MRVTLISSDGQHFEIDRQILQQIEMLSGYEDSSITSIPLPEVDGDTLKLVLEWCEAHRNGPLPAERPRRQRGWDVRPVREDPWEVVPRWEQDFFKALDIPSLFKLINAANFLDAKQLLDMSCQNVAHQIKGKTPQEIRDHFGFENDLTPEEEAETTAWCEE